MPAGRYLWVFGAFLPGLIRLAFVVSVILRVKA